MTLQRARWTGWAAAALLSSVVGACTCGETPESPSPAAGEKGGFCDPAGGCGPGLACVAGYCAPTGCTPGSLDCVCGSRGECDVLDGTPMTCAGNVCVPTVAAAPGSVGGACGELVSCGPGLECTGGVCERPDCPSGRLGCACGEFGACEDFEGRPVRCHQGACTLGGCQPGTLGCRCDEGRCTGAVCIDGLCRAPNLVRVEVSGAGVRACDVLLKENGGPSGAGVRFTARMKGAAQSRAGRLALSFIGRGDADVAGEVATVEPSSKWTGSFALAHSACYDRLGRPAAGGKVELR